MKLISRNSIITASKIRVYRYKLPITLIFKPIDFKIKPKKPTIYNYRISIQSKKCQNNNPIIFLYDTFRLFLCKNLKNRHFSYVCIIYCPQ